MPRILTGMPSFIEMIRTIRGSNTNVINANNTIIDGTGSIASYNGNMIPNGAAHDPSLLI